MTSSITAPPAIPAPYELSAQEYVDALTAMSFALHNEVVYMTARVESMRPRARAEVLAQLELLMDLLRATVRMDMATAVLTPDALPIGVEGVHVGGRS